MSVFNSITVGALLVLLITGLFTGIFASGTDILNPQTSAAEANRMNMETNHKEAIYVQEERLKETETNAQIRTIEREQNAADATANYNQSLLNLNLQNKARWAATWLLIVTWVGGALSVSLVISTIFWMGSKAVANIKAVAVSPQSNSTDPVQSTNDPWQLDAYRKAKIAEARYREHSERQEEIIKEREEQIELMIRMQSISDPASLGKTKYDNLPLAG